jgi:hypothetical protein
MCTNGSDREELLTISRKKKWFAVSLPEQPRATADLRERCPLREVESTGQSLYVVHLIPLDPQIGEGFCDWIICCRVLLTIQMSFDEKPLYVEPSFLRTAP